MDTSDQYIKMCDCPEIQKQKPEGNEFSISYKNPDIWIEHEGNFLYARHDLWLPRQDQIQEMIQPILRNAHTFERHWHVLLKELQDWWHLNPEYVANLLSMEQLWLAFFMHEKHKKKWDGKNWVA